MNENEHMEAFLKRWYKYARYGKIMSKDKSDWYKEQMDYIEKAWRELKDSQRCGIYN